MAASKKKTRNRWARRGIAGASLAALIGVVVLAWLPKPMQVEAVAVKRGTLRVTIDEDGQTRVKDRYTVSSPVAGSVARIELRAGDAVDAGDVLARVVPLTPALLDRRGRAQARAQVAAAHAAQRQTRSAVSRARVAAEFADAEAARQRRLLRAGGSAEQAAERADMEARAHREDLASAKFAARVADHELELARAALGRGKKGERADDPLELKAPVAGKVLRVVQTSEGVIQPGAPLLEIGDPSALEIVVDVLTSDAVSVHSGVQVEIDRWGGEATLRGHVRLVEPSAFTRVSALGVDEQRVNVIVDLEDPHERWKSLGDGYRVEARLVIWEGQNVLLAPASSVFRHGSGWATYKLQKGVARLVPLQIGRRSPHTVQIMKGAVGGDRFIVHPSDQVRDGVRCETPTER